MCNFNADNLDIAVFINKYRDIPINDGDNIGNIYHKFDFTETNWLTIISTVLKYPKYFNKVKIHIDLKNDLWHNQLKLIYHKLPGDGNVILFKTGNPGHCTLLQFCKSYYNAIHEKYPKINFEPYAIEL